QQKAWALRLLAISCIYLASKMIKPGMKGLVLGALEWRMRSITSFSFLTFFITLIYVKDPMEQVLKKRVDEIIFKSQ
ncbi:hypothetical protein HN51_026160, partial [Arachis hypogaea]